MVAQFKDNFKRMQITTSYGGLLRNWELLLVYFFRRQKPHHRFHKSLPLYYLTPNFSSSFPIVLPYALSFFGGQVVFFFEFFSARSCLKLSFLKYYFVFHLPRLLDTNFSRFFKT